MSLSDKALAMQAGMLVGSAVQATSAPLPEPTFTEQEKFLQQLAGEFSEHLQGSITTALNQLGVSGDIITPEQMDAFELISQEPQLAQQGLTEILTHMYALRRKSDGVFCAWTITVTQGLNTSGERTMEEVVITTSKINLIHPNPTPEAPHAIA